MHVKTFRKKLILLALVIVLGIYYVTFTKVKTIQDDLTHREDHESIDRRIENLNKMFMDRHFNKPKLAVLVPCRLCFERLSVFVKHLTEFLNDRQISHHIFIANQTERYLINRGALMNVGFLFVKEIFDYIVIHDVDTLPLNRDLSYDCPSEGVMQLTARHDKELPVSEIKFDFYLF